MTVALSTRQSGPFTMVDGQTIVNYGFPVDNANELKVLRGRGGAIAVLELDVDYGVTNVGMPTGTIILTSGSVAGDKVTVVGDLPIQRVSNFSGWRSIPDNAINKELDRMVKSLQEMQRDTRQAMAVDPNTGDNDARGNRVINMADGIDPNDAVTMRQLQETATGSNLNFSSLDPIDEVATDDLFAVWDASAGRVRHATPQQLADEIIGENDVEVFKGFIDCAANPNYPAADAGHVYRVSVAGKIGGASGIKVEANDRLECSVVASAPGNQATVGANWGITQANIETALLPIELYSDDIDLLAGATPLVDFRRIGTGATNTPEGAPVNGSVVQTYVWDSSSAVQVYMDTTQPNAIWSRNKSSNTWSAWEFVTVIIPGPAVNDEIALFDTTSGKRIKSSGGVKVSTDQTMAANSDLNLPTEKAVRAYIDGLNGVFDVKKYGAVGDGVADDTSAIQAAITACEAAGGGTVYFSQPKYKVAELTATGTKDIAFLGTPGKVSILYTGLTRCIELAAGTGRIYFSDLVFDPPSNSGVTAIKANGNPRVDFHRIKIRGPGYKFGILVGLSYAFKVRGCTFVNTADYAIYADTGSGQNGVVEGNGFFGCGVANSSGALYVNSAEQMTIEDNEFASNNIDIFLQDCRSVPVQKNYFEYGASVLWLGGVNAAISLFDNWLYNTMVTIQNVDGFVVDRNVLAGAISIDVGGAATRVNFGVNDISLKTSGSIPAFDAVIRAPLANVASSEVFRVTSAGKLILQSGAAVAKGSVGHVFGRSNWRTDRHSRLAKNQCRRDR